MALANFKREHGYENVDLRTLESNLHREQKSKLTTSPTITKTMSQSERDKKRRKLLLSTTHHRFYPASPPLQHNDTLDRLIKKNASRSCLANIPLSETRLQMYGSRNSPTISSSSRTNTSRKLSLSSDDEDAAHLLVMMHQSPTMSS